MNVKIITFLGTSARETVYEYQGKTYKGNLFQIALREFMDFDEMLVFVTPEAKKAVYSILKDLNDPRIKAVDIRTGKSSEGLWDIFDKLVKNVDDEDTVIFDITHGLRSTPFLMFLAAAYLRSAKSINLQAVLYGAFELGQPAPVIDLSEFVGLLDWTIATDRFTQTGDGRPLAKLLQQAGQFEHPKRALTPLEQAQQRNAKKIVAAANAISNTSGTLLATMIPNAQYQSHLLNIRLQEAETGLFAELPPYRILAQQIRETYGTFGAEKPMQNDIAGDLAIQLKILRWYIDNGQTPQAVTLMREWVVTAVGYNLKMRPPQLLDHKTGRKFIEGAINLYLKDPLPSDVPAETMKYLKLFSKLDNAKSVAEFWHSLINIRNLVDHGAMHKNWRDYDPHKIAELMDKKYKTLLTLELSEPA